MRPVCPGGVAQAPDKCDLKREDGRKAESPSRRVIDPNGKMGC